MKTGRIPGGKGATEATVEGFEPGVNTYVVCGERKGVVPSTTAETCSDYRGK